MPEFTQFIIMSLNLIHNRSFAEIMEKWKKVSAGVIGALLLLVVIVISTLVALNTRYLLTFIHVLHFPAPNGLHFPATNMFCWN